MSARALAIHPGALGDVLLAIPALRALTHGTGSFTRRRVGMEPAPEGVLASAG